MKEIFVLSNKINSIIQKAPNKEYTEEFIEIAEELNKLQGNSIAIRKNNFFTRLINSVRTRFFSSQKEEFDDEKYEQLKNKAIKLYADKILKKEYPIMIKNEENGLDAYFIDTSFGLKRQDKLFTQISDYIKYYTRLEEKTDGTIEIYPFNVKAKELEKRADSEYLGISKDFFTTEDTIEKLFENRIADFVKKNKKIKDVFMQRKINSYFGSPEFICERSKYVLECMEKILSEKNEKGENREETVKLVEQAKKLVEDIKNCKNNLETENSKKQYNQLKQEFQKLLLIEEIISKDVEKLWRDFLTDPKDYKEDKRFAFLVHTFTGDIVEKSNLNKCCCTLVTDKCMPIPYGNFGVICDFKTENITSMCNEDAGSWLVSKEELFERGLPIEWQFAEDAGDGKNKVWFEEPKISKLITPTQMENEMIRNNLNQNSRDGQKHRIYTEIFMVKGSKGEEIPVQEMFYTDKDGQEILQKRKNNFNPIMLDPSKGTMVSFDEKEMVL